MLSIYKVHTLLSRYLYQQLAIVKYKMKQWIHRQLKETRRSVGVEKNAYT